MKKIFYIFAVFLPNPIKIFIYRTFFKWKIGKNGKVGFSFIYAERVVLKDNVKIGHFNVINRLKYLEIGENSKIGNFNKIYGSGKIGWENCFIAGNNLGITSSHLFDVGGGIYIGNSVTVAGINSQIWSHEISLEQAKLIPKSTHIGSNIYIGSSVLLAPGCTIPSNSIVGLGAVVPAKLKSDDFSLIIGNPAVAKENKFSVVKELNAS